MPERSRQKKPRDVNELAASILEAATGDSHEQKPAPKQPEKNAAASQLAHQRSEKLSPQRRSEIARKAANARWSKP